MEKIPLTKAGHGRLEVELKKLKSMSSMSAEATVVRNYLDWMIELPWSNNKDKKTDTINITEAKKIPLVPDDSMNSVEGESTKSPEDGSTGSHDGGSTSLAGSGSTCSDLSEGGEEERSWEELSPPL